MSQLCAVTFGNEPRATAAFLEGPLEAGDERTSDTYTEPLLQYRRGLIPGPRCPPCTDRSPRDADRRYPEPALGSRTDAKRPWMNPESGRKRTQNIERLADRENELNIYWSYAVMVYTLQLGIADPRNDENPLDGRLNPVNAIKCSKRGWFCYPTQEAYVHFPMKIDCWNKSAGLITSEGNKWFFLYFPEFDLFRWWCLPLRRVAVVNGRSFYSRKLAAER